MTSPANAFLLLIVSIVMAINSFTFGYGAADMLHDIMAAFGAGEPPRIMLPLGSQLLP